MKIAIYSGSFNPIHFGHLTIAQAALTAGIDELWFVVSPQNPLKNNSDLWPENDRLEMVRLAVKDETRMKASNYEFHLSRPSYTINTLDLLKKEYPQHEFTLLIGGDNLANFHKWRQHQRILDEYGLMVFPRPGFSNPQLEQHPNVRIIEAPLLYISSTAIRRRVYSGEPIDTMVPKEVKEYILNNGLYVQGKKGTD
jgi:nicotinate-nucleotide adenylyltransferase